MSKAEQQRLLLHDILCNIEGVSSVYYQPPSNHVLKYPCLIYGISDYNNFYSNNIRYLTFPRYNLTLIDKNPKSSIHEKIMSLGNGCYVDFDRFFTSDNLNHWAYTLYFDKGLW
jgi:hypothetical protein